MNSVASRRGFLKGFATVSAVTGAAVVPFVAKATPSEDVELLQLDDKLASAASHYLECCAAKAVCVAEFERIKPEIPPDLLRPRNSDPRLGHDWPFDADGIQRPAMFDHRVSLYGRWALGDQSRRVDGRTRYGKMVRRLYRICERYHTEHEAARITSGTRDADGKRFTAGRAVLALGFEVMAVDATTKAGLAVKGRAGLAMHRVWADESGRQIEHSYDRLLRNLATVNGGEIPLCA